jgi:C-terminal processing protease CtpA/Prc
MRAEIIAINGTPIDEYVDSTFPWSGPYSNEQVERLQLLRYAVRSPVGTAFEVTFRNPGDSSEQTVTLTSIDERESHAFSSFYRGVTGAEVPVEFKMLDNGYGYVKIYSFFDNALLSIQLWERMMLFLNENEIPGLIVDMRQNGGGDTFLSRQMAAYFFDEPLSVGNTGYYDKDTDDFFFDPAYAETFLLPTEDLRYHGAVAVLVSPNCASACEFFSYDMSLQGRAAIVGQYPTAGLGGSIDSFLMPEDEEIVFTIGRAVDMNGNIHIEGTGVPPTVQVPVNEETLFSDGDPVLDAAVTYLDVTTEDEVVRSTP